MKVLFSKLSPFSWTKGNIKLDEAYKRLIPDIMSVAREFESCYGDYTLCVVLCCPCCEEKFLEGLPEQGKGVVWVSPFPVSDVGLAHGMYTLLISPPGHDGFHGVASCDAHFLKEWRKLIERALQVTQVVRQKSVV